MLRTFSIVSVAVSLQALTLSPLFSCTTFLMSNNEDRSAFVGKNYDWPVKEGIVHINKRGVRKKAVITGVGNSLLQTHSLIQQKPATWASKFSSVTFNQFGREFPNGGMNEAGLVVEIMRLRDSEMPHEVTDGESINEFQWIQYQLDNFSTVGEMIEHTDFLNIIPLYGEVHFLACDRNRDCAAFEYSNRKWVVTSGQKLKVNTLTNSSYPDSIAALSQHCGFGGDKALPTDTKSLSRFIRASSLAAKYPDQNPSKTSEAVDYGFQILDNVAFSDDTQWQIIYDIDKSGVYFRTKEEKSHNIKFIDLNYFDLSNNGPVMTLNIESTLSGDVSPYFKPYNRAKNIQLLDKTMKKIAPFNLTDPVQTMTNLPLTFQCL